MFRRIIFSLLIVLLTSYNFAASDSNISWKFKTPIIKNYSPDVYHGKGQVWGIVQDKRGLMYFSNSNNGLLEYDGAKWKKIRLKTSQTVRALAINNEGIVFVGSIGDFGYLKVINGETTYFSLLKYIPKKERLFNDIWQVVTLKDAVYFRSQKAIFRWKNGKIKVFKAETRFYTTAVINNKLYILQRKKGLMTVIGDELVEVKSSKQIIKEKSGIYAILPHENGQILLVARAGIYIFNGKFFKRFYTEADNFLIKNKIYKGIALPNGLYALATKMGGVLIINRKGEIKQIINKQKGLYDNNVRYLYLDKENVLWIGLNDGISKAEIFSKVSIFEERVGFKGKIYEIKKHKGRLIVISSIGAFRQITNPNKKLFEWIRQVKSEPRSIETSGNTLIIASTVNLHIINGKKVRTVHPFFRITYFKKSKINPSIFFVGTDKGLQLLSYKKGKFKKSKFKIKEINKISSLNEDENGKVWVSLYNGNILSIDFKNGYNNKPKVITYTREHGLTGEPYRIFKVGSKLLFSNSNHILSYYKSKNRFLPSKIFNSFFADKQISQIEEDQDGNLWILTSIYRKVYYAKKASIGKYKITLMSHLSSPRLKPVLLFPDKDGSLWISSKDSLVHYDPNIVIPRRIDFNTIIRRIENKSRVLFGKRSASSKKKIQLPFKDNSIQIYFSSTSYLDENENLFQVLLKGHQNNWSEWSNDRYVKFTNLSPGNYTFSVRSKNIYGKISNIASIDFKILSPWYRTWWAYVFYVFMFIGIIIGISAVRLRRLKLKADALEKERDILEERVKERTKELQETYNMIKADLNMAKRIQTSILPSEYKNDNLLNIKVEFLPMIEVGGDIYDVYKINDHTYRFFLADATGHGIQAALTTMIIKAEYDKIKIFDMPPNEIIEIFNDIFFKNYYSLTVFFTCIVMDMDLKNNLIHFSSAGHPVQYVIDNNQLLSLDSCGKLVGLDKKVKYNLKTIEFSDNTKVLLFTDGLFEQFSENEEEFGEANLKKLILENKNLSIEKMMDMVINYIHKWIGKNQVNDDITIIGLQKNWP